MTEIERLRKDQDSTLDDLAALLRALGMFDGARPESPHEVMQKAIVRAEQLREDAERLDFIEAAIRDGSYASILNDIVAVCQHAYANIGPGPALRTTIDTIMPPVKEPKL